MRRWRFFIDTGGTFTDCIAVAPDGTVRSRKVLSSGCLRRRVRKQEGARLQVADLPPFATDDWHAFVVSPGGDRAVVPVVAAEPATGWLELATAPNAVPALIELQSPWPAPVLAVKAMQAELGVTPDAVIAMRLATTRGTNALLERGGVPPVLLVSQGFSDLLEIGDQSRDALFALDIPVSQPLTRQVYELPLRCGPDGGLVDACDAEEIAAQLAAIFEDGTDAAPVAVSLAHSWANSAQEQQVLASLETLGIRRCAAGSGLSRSIGYLARTRLAVVDAYLTPVVRGFVDDITAALPNLKLDCMTSSGGIVPATHFNAAESLLSGPAGGVVGAASVARRVGIERAIAFDMGGTSTDVSRIEDGARLTDRHRVGDVELETPAVAIQTVAAGGGSICWYDGVRLRVGPQSAGAQPGPACYGMAGPLTVTDVDLLLGRLSPSDFATPVDVAAAQQAADALAKTVAQATGEPMPVAVMLEGLLDIADERMADAIRHISTRQGVDPADYSLIAFGGAGGVHACSVAERLGIARVIMPQRAGLLSAVGVAAAPTQRVCRESLCLDAEDWPAIAAAVARVTARAKQVLIRDGADPAQLETKAQVDVRLRGQNSCLDVAWPPDGDLATTFNAAYADLYGHQPPTHPLEIAAVQVVAWDDSGYALATESSWWRQVGGEARAHSKLVGPAVLVEPGATAYIPHGWQGTSADDGSLRLGKMMPTEVAATDDDRTPQAIALALFTTRLNAIAEEMGEQLRRTAMSVNVKERLDFSCAVLDAAATVVASAPHVPVHLGAIGVCVRAIFADQTAQPGVSWITNHPAFGGSHLPDVTVVTPVFLDGQLIGYVANRAHHAEIGGTTPGSAPPDAATLDEEGVPLAPFVIESEGHFHADALRQRLLSHRWPTRAVAENEADVRAALAANHRGASMLRAFVAATGWHRYTDWQQRLRASMLAQVRAALSDLPQIERSAQVEVDGGGCIRVRIAPGKDRWLIDFAGTSPRHKGSLNAPQAVVRSAVMYVLRLLLTHDLPLHECLLDAVDVRIPEGSCLDTGADAQGRYCAVVGGNTEISQLIVTALLQALGLAASSQGTMNNVLIGNADFGYYETIGGGVGATANGPGAHARHTHMTNTRITDVERIEQRYPIRIRRFQRRRGSGGVGRHPGGDGIVREYEFQTDVEISILSQHRTHGPVGLDGGGAGAPGRQYVIYRDGAGRELEAVDGVQLAAGDRLVVETPGGGGWGAPDTDD